MRKASIPGTDLERVDGALSEVRPVISEHVLVVEVPEGSRGCSIRAGSHHGHHDWDGRLTHSLIPFFEVFRQKGKGQDLEDGVKVRCSFKRDQVDFSGSLEKKLYVETKKEKAEMRV